MRPRTPFRRLFARFMRAFFYLLYQPLAWSYDLVAWLVSSGRWQDWIASVLPYLEGPRVLEIGHGPGHLQLALQSGGIAALGLDASRQMGRQAQKRLHKKGFPVSLVRGYAQVLPFQSGVADQIVATFPTEFIYAANTLAEIQRVLKPGGRLVVLPVAWITGKRLADRGTAALFRVTGQAPDWNEAWLEPFRKAGFQTRVEMLNQKSWSVAIILAEKPDQE